MSVTQQVQDARRNDAFVVLEGFHAIKHALRFNATIERIITDDTRSLLQLAQELAPDITEQLATSEEVSPEVFATLSRVPVESHAIAIAARPLYSLSMLAARPERIVLLDTPTHPGNVGACIRVAAARGVAGVIVTGPIDPWQGGVVRGAAGLQFAVPVVPMDDPTSLTSLNRPLVAFHEVGTPLPDASISDEAILVFGSERRGISPALRAQTRETVMIPMQQGVSSLNLATSVAIALYAR